MSLDFINHGGACHCHADPVSLGETCYASFANALTEPYQMLVCCVFVSDKKSATVGWSRVIGDSAHRDRRNCCMRSSANYCCLR